MNQITLLRFEWKRARHRAWQAKDHGDRAGELIANSQAEALYRAINAGPRAASEPSVTDSRSATTTPEN